MLTSRALSMSRTARRCRRNISCAEKSHHTTSTISHSSDRLQSKRTTVGLAQTDFQAAMSDRSSLLLCPAALHAPPQRKLSREGCMCMYVCMFYRYDGGQHTWAARCACTASTLARSCA